MLGLFRIDEDQLYVIVCLQIVCRIRLGVHSDIFMNWKYIYAVETWNSYFCDSGILINLYTYWGFRKSAFEYSDVIETGTALLVCQSLMDIRYHSSRNLEKPLDFLDLANCIWILRFCKFNYNEVVWN
jgi:hypothetical protein